jgi:hypothetical protein
MEYDDGLIACSDAGLLIRRYGAFLRPKKVAYADIRGVTQVGLSGLSFGRWRIWGSTDLRHWFNFDWHRPKKHVGLVLDLGKRMEPVITPRRSATGRGLLRQHGVDVAER